MGAKAKERILETYRQTAGIYDSGVSERLGEARWGIESLTGLLMRDLHLPRSPKLLDLGCGTGLSLFKIIEDLDSGAFYGVDLSPEMIKQARINAQKLGYDIDFRIGDAEDLDFDSEMFDAVVSNMSFQMFPDKKKSLQEAYRVLQPGGLIGLLYPGENHLRELVELCREYADSNPALKGFSDSLMDTEWMHIGVEETQRLFWEVGFRRPLIYGYHRVMHVRPESFWFNNPYPAMWRSQVPLNQRKKLDQDIVHLMKVDGKRGFKLNWYTIQAYGVKPV